MKDAIERPSRRGWPSSFSHHPWSLMLILCAVFSGAVLFAGTLGHWATAHHGMLPWWGRALVALGLVGCAVATGWRGCVARVGSIAARRVPDGLLLACVVAVLVLLRERRFFGDAAMAWIIPLAPEVLMADHIFTRAPLGNLIQYMHWKYLLEPWCPPADLLLGWQLILAAWGAVVLVGAYWISRAIARGRRGARLLFGVYAAGGMVFLSMGHIENYPISVAFFALWIGWCLNAVRAGNGAMVASVGFGAVVMSHPVTLIYLPCLAVVFLREFRHPRQWAWAAPACVLCFMVVPLAMMAVKGGVFRWDDFAGGDPANALLPADQVFTGGRLLEVGLVVLRILPLLPLVVCGAVLMRRRLALRDFQGLFLTLAASASCCWCLFAWNKMPLEMDWDFFSHALFALTCWMMWLLWRLPPAGQRLRVLTLAILLQVPHTALLVAWQRLPDPVHGEEFLRMVDHTIEVLSGGGE